MNHIHHPENKQERLLIAEKKHKFVDTKKGKIKAERPAKVQRKLTLDHLKEEEILQELRNASSDQRSKS